MRTRSSSNLIVESSTIPKRRNRRRSKQIVKPELRTIVETLVATMANTRTMSELLQAPTEGYKDVIVLPAILAKKFELKVGLLTLGPTSQKLVTGYRPQGETNYRASNQMRPPGFPQPNVQNNQNRYNQNQGYNQNRGNNFNQGNQNYQAPLNQTQVGPSNDFSNYMKTNDVNIRAMQNQINNMKAEFKNEVQTTMRNQSNELNNDIKNMMSSFFQMQSPSGSGSLPSNTIANPRGDLKVITTQSGVSYDGPMIPPTSSPLPKEVEREPEATKDKFLQIFQRLHFDISFADALLHMPKFASTFKSILSNKEKLFKLANTPLNENCSTVLLKKLPEKLRDPDKFLIPCDFLELDECLALSDLGANINLMPLFVWKKLSLMELTPTRMTLELANRSVAYSVGVAEDVFLKVGKFHFPTDFFVVDYDVDPQVPLILGRPFLRTTRELIDVHGEELTLRVNDEAITFNVRHTLRYSYRYDDESVNRIDVIDITYEEYAQEVLRFSNSSKSGNPTLSSDPIITTSSPSLTPFEGGDFVLEEIEACLTNNSIPSGINDADFDPEGDILLLEKLLNDDPSSPLPPKEINIEELKIIKSYIDDPPELKLKDLPSHLEYAFLEGTNKLPVVIAKNLKDEEKALLLKVLKSHKRAIAWKISDIKGIDPQICTHKILMDDYFKPAVQHQRRVNPKVHEVIKKEVIKLLDAGLIYPISDSPWLNDATRKDHFLFPFMDQMLERKSQKTNNKVYKLNEVLSNCETDLYNYKRGLSQVEARLVEFKNNEIKFCERIRVLERDVELKDNKIENLRNELEELKKEKDSIDFKIKKFENSAKDLDCLLGTQRSVKDKTGLGLNEYTVVPPPPAQVYSPPKNDLSWTGLPEFVVGPVTDLVGPTLFSKVNNLKSLRKLTVKYVRNVQAQRPREIKEMEYQKSQTEGSDFDDDQDSLLCMSEVLKHCCTSVRRQQRQKIKKKGRDLEHKGEGSENPTEPHHTPSPQASFPQSQEPIPHKTTTLTSSQEPTSQQISTPSHTPTPRRLTKRAIRIAQSKALTPGADEPASPPRDDSHGEAFPTATSLDAGQDRENIPKTSAMPHESSPRVTSLGGDEGSLQLKLNELMDFCTKLQSQHSQMAAKIQSQDLEISQLKTRIKTLEDAQTTRGDVQEDAPNRGE
ncbi:reverse transcriptase domain-containing protein [Tanacetum coccineum]